MDLLAILFSDKKKKYLYSMPQTRITLKHGTVAYIHEGLELLRMVGRQGVEKSS